MATLSITTRRLTEWATIAFALLTFAGNAVSQEPAASPTAAAKAVRISFLPPPLEGNISLGIYDGNGKLVRVLHREADLDEFEAGSDALLAKWDGNNDAGQRMPAGKYHARGFVVGDLEVEGVGFFFNDWIEDDRPERIDKICAIAGEGEGVIVSARVGKGASATLICDGAGKIIAARQDAPVVGCDNDSSPAAATPIASAAGRDGTRWAIEISADDPNQREVKQYAATGELLRNLVIPSTDPQPVKIAASRDAERIFLLEQSASMQRLRSLSLVATTATGAEHSISNWKVDFEKKISVHTGFRVENGKAVLTAGEAPPAKIAVKLQANALLKEKAANVDLAVGHDEDGSFLETADGLPLQSISETKNLTRLVLAPHEDKSVDVFQDDGAVVEQFRISGLDQMMAFDCGEIELK